MADPIEAAGIVVVNMLDPEEGDTVPCVTEADALRILAERDEQIAALQAQLDAVREVRLALWGYIPGQPEAVTLAHRWRDILAAAPSDVSPVCTCFGPPLPSHWDGCPAASWNTALAARDARVAAEALEEAAHQGWVAEGTRSALRARAAVIRAGVTP